MKILLVGGTNGLSPHYRKAVKDRGYELEHVERGGLPGQGRSQQSSIWAAIIVCTEVSSHPMLAAAKKLAAECGAPLAYMRSPSISALRRALDEALPSTPGVRT